MSLEGYRILAIGPAFSDVLVNVSDCMYESIKTKLFPNDKTWCAIDNECFFEKILKSIVAKSSDILFEAGTSILGTLSALSPENRKDTCILTYKYNSKNVISENSYNYYERCVKSLGMALLAQESIGINKVGIVISSPNNLERLLITLKEPFHESNTPIVLPNAEYLYIDAYELQNNNYFDLINQAILSNRYKVIIGLGNKSIICGKVRKKIIEYILSDVVFCLAGNYEEFQSLYSFPELNSLRKISIYNKIPNILVTQGSIGMTGYINQETMYQCAFKTQNVVNTSGAGDIALGVFIDGILSGSCIDNILKRATKYSAEILKRRSNVFTEGIEHVRPTNV